MLVASGVLAAFEINPDEGVNLIKAALLSQGDSLYGSIWSDQPPVLTYVLSGIVACCGRSVIVPRLLMLLASTGVVWGVGRHLCRRHGLPHALVAQTLILSQPAFYFFGGSIMVGLPAIYLAFVAAFVLIGAADGQHAWPRSLWLGLSALLLALSLMTKLFTVVVMPAAVVFLATTAPSDSGPLLRRQSALFLWIVVFTVSVGVLFLALIGWEDGAQLVSGHARAMTSYNEQGWKSHTLGLHLARLPWLAPLAVLGAGFAIYQRDRAALLFVGWVTVATLALSVHYPVWLHQQLLVTLPAALLGGIGVGELLSRLIRRAQPAPFVVSLVPGALLAACIVFVAIVQHRDWQEPERKAFDFGSDNMAVTQLVDRMAIHGRDTPLLITDRPMLAYRAGLNVPPWIAALTQKRLVTQQLSAQDLIAEIEAHAPPQVVLARFRLPGVQRFLSRRYHLEARNRLGAVYVRNATADGAGSMSSAEDWHRLLRRAASWYGSGDAHRMAEMVLLNQGPNGGWPKTMPGLNAKVIWVPRKDEADESLDNESTTAPLRFLARMVAEHDEPRYRTALQHGVDYLLLSQDANGAWPQVYPHLYSYHAYSTLNDGVTVDAARFLADLQTPQGSRFIDATQRLRSQRAVKRTVDFMVRAQVRVGGQRTGWCQQYDPVTLEPRPARVFEPVALASRESADVLSFLMEQPQPSATVKDAVHAGVAWLKGVQLAGLRVEERVDDRSPQGRNRVAVADPTAPPIWARFYDMSNQQPMFVGRDGVPRPDFNEIDAERRAGYDYLVHEPSAVLNVEYPQWCHRHATWPLDHASQGMTGR